jgi:hypothetical protein
MATLFIDYENGNDNWGGTSFAPVASGTDGRISSNTFSSVSANFLDNGTYANKNLIAYSQSLNNAQYFAYARTTIAPASITPPTSITGTLWNILETLETNSHDLRTVSASYVVVTGSTYTFSCYARANGRNQLVVRFGDTAAKGIRYNISTGIIEASGASATGTISDAGNGWYRLTLTATADNTSPLVYMMLTDNAYTGTTAQTYTGDPTKGFYITSPQLELSGSATSYETPPSTPQYLSIFNGTSYVVYQILNRINSTSLNIMAIMGGTALANQAVDRQYFIGGRWQSLTTGASSARVNPGDNIRFMASPDPTSIGNATWTSSRQFAVGGISSSTNASPISITVPNHGFTTGDTILVYGHTVNTNANGTWNITVTGTSTFTLNGSTGNGVGANVGTVRKINNCVITLPVALTANIASYGNRGNGRTAWTASANVTASLDTADFKEGDCSDSIAVGASFTTGNAAYKATGALNLSGYQQVSFWIKQTAGTVAVNGDASLRLCSDALGATSVHTINIPGLVVLNRWVPVTVNLSTNLSATINSVALYVDADKGAQTFLISNIVACKASSSADSINLLSLLSKNRSNEPCWFPIQSINGTRIIIDRENNVLPTSTNCRGYYGTSETTNTFKLEAIKRPYASTATTNTDTINEGGLELARINISGGWDRNNMSVRNGVTWLDGGNGFGNLIYAVNNKNYIDFSYFGFTRCNAGLWTQSNVYWTVSDIYGSGVTTYPVYLFNQFKSNFTNIFVACCGGASVYYGVSGGGCSFTNIIGIGCAHGFHNSYSGNSTMNNILMYNNSNNILLEHSALTYLIGATLLGANYGINLSGGAANNYLKNITISDNAINSVIISMADNYFENAQLNDSVEFAPNVPFSNGRAISINHDNISNNYYIATDYGIITNTVAVRYSNSGFAWALSPTNVRRDSTYPLSLAVAKVAVGANSLVTVRAWVRRSSIFLTMGLRVKGGQIGGPTNDVTSYMTGAADTWEQVILNFTPSTAGVVEILAECYGGTTLTGYVDDITITQV